MPWGRGQRDVENPMQDLFENYVSELNKLREAFHNELAATSEELSQAMDMYARRGEAVTSVVHGESFRSWRGARSGGCGEAQ